MDWSSLLKLIPVVAGSINPLAGVVASAVQKLAEEEIARRQAANPSLTRDEIIAAAGADWDLGVGKAENLKKLGHEGDQL
jgi:hypothetical protein